MKFTCQYRRAMKKGGKEENAFKIKRLTVAGLSPSAVQRRNESRKQQRFRLAMMSAILGTLFILGGSAKLLLFLLFCMSPLVSRTKQPSPRPTNISPTATRTVNSAQFFNSFLSRPPKPPIQRYAPLPAHALSYKEAAAGQER